MSIINNFKNENFRNNVLIIFIFSLVSLGIIYQYFKQKSIETYKERTVGTVVKFESINMARFGIIYEYKINHKVYQGQVGVSSFECDNGKKGCVGKNFPVYYSSENPKYSKIDLGIYEKYKTTVEFFD